MSLPTIFDCPNCGRTVCNICYCTGYPAHPIQPKPEPVDVHTAMFHALWSELHEQVRTPEQFASWVKKVPSFGCSCASWLKDYLASHPLTDDLRMYGWELHCAVNAKLNKPFFSQADFESKYG